jgi:hypothetical protein
MCLIGILFFVFVYCDGVDLSLYDIDSITAETNYTYVDYTLGTTFYFNFRKPLENSCTNDCISKTNYSDRCCYGSVSTEQYEFTVDMTGIVFTYGYYGSSFVGTTYINVYCKTGRIQFDAKLKFTYIIFFYICFSSTTVIIINIKAPGGCLKSSISSEKKSILSWGFFFVLGCIIIILLYVVIGFPITVLYEKKRGFDMIPLFRFIKEFVSLVKV